MAICFSREVAPESSRTRALGTRSDFASNSVTARLASPPSPIARTRTLSTLRPSASVSTPSISSRPPRGVTRKATLMPAVEVRQGSISYPGKRSDHVRIDVVHDHPLDEHDQQNHDDRRNIEAAEIGHD